MIEKLDGFRMPAEWEPQKSIWIAWPYNKKDWPDLFYFIPEVVAKIVKAISEDQKVDLLINKDKQQVLKTLKLSPFLISGSLLIFSESLFRPKKDKTELNLSFFLILPSTKIFS